MANVNNGYNSEEEDLNDDEEIDESGFKTIKDAVLFAIDISPSMLTPSSSSSAQLGSNDGKKAGSDSPALAALKCAYQLMQQRIISNPRDMMGILLFGTAKSRFEGEDESKTGGLAYPHCYLLTELDVPAAMDVLKVRRIVEDESVAAELLQPTSDEEEPVSMANVLFCANQIFTTKAPNFSSRRLFLITDNDNPHARDRALRSAATVRAKDLYNLGVIIELFPIAKAEHGFDRGLFYNDIVYRPPMSDPEAPIPIASATRTASSGDGISLLQSLLSSINSKNTPRQALFSLPLELGPDFKISVKGYIIVKRQEPIRSCYVWLSGEKAQIAVGTSKQVSEDSARTVEKAEIRKAYKFGGETVSFTKEEAEKIRSFGEPIIRVIGFKSLSKLPMWASIRAPIFMYPSEEGYIGSIRVFSALHQKLLTSQRFALCWFIARKNASPVLAAVYAGAERISEDGDQVIPPGLWIQPLPFMDDIRQNPESSLVQASDSLIDAMRVVIQQLQLPKARYEPQKYPNPSLQWFYRILQALALEEDLPEQPEDKTVPRYRQINKRAGQYILEWGQILDENMSIWQRRNSVKREGDNFHGNMPKRVKSEKASFSKSIDTPDDAAMKHAYTTGALDQFSVAALKAWINIKKLRSGVKKADLVEVIEQYFEAA